MTTRLRDLLYEAIQKENISQIKSILDQNPELVHARTPGGSIPLHPAAFKDNTEILSLLILKGADVNAKNNNGWTPLFVASEYGRRKNVELLINEGATVNAKDNEGATPLHISSMRGHKEVVELLISKGADITLIDNYGHTPLHLASWSGKKDVAELLITQGIDVDVTDFGGDTPIHGASYHGHKEVVKLLISKGAKLNLKNEEGRTPLDNAARLSHKDTFTILITARMQTSEGLEAPIKFTILYDNFVYNGGKSAHGFSCFIEGTEKTILFDTGGDSKVLMGNIEYFNVDLRRVEKIVITHNHWDHTGGLFEVLDKNNDIPIYLPISFPYDFIRKVEGKGAEVINVYEPIEICDNVFLTGEMGDRIKEQSLIINSRKGLVIVTGCSHQGIVNILKLAKKLFNKEIYLVFGGFHLGAKKQSELKEILRYFRELGVVKCGATHCTGEKAISMFKEAYRENYVAIGTGRVLEI